MPITGHFVHFSRQSVVAVYITCSLYAKKVQFSRKERAVEWKTAEVSCIGCSYAEHSTFSGRYSCWHLKRNVFPTNDNSVNNAALSCWAAVCRGCCWYNRWPTDHWCSAGLAFKGSVSGPKLVVHNAVNIGDQWYQLKSVVGRDLSFERTSCFQSLSNGLFAFITDETGVLKILFAACNAKPLQMQRSKSESNG